MKDKFTETYKKIITECTEHGVSEGFLGTLGNKMKQGFHSVSHLGSANSAADNDAANKERFKNLFEGSGWTSIKSNIWQNDDIDGKVINVKYDSGKKKIFVYVNREFAGKLPLDPAADEDSIRKALNKIQKNSNGIIPDLSASLTDKKTQDKNAADKAAKDADNKENENLKIDED